MCVTCVLLCGLWINSNAQWTEDDAFCWIFYLPLQLNTWEAKRHKNKIYLAPLSFTFYGQGYNDCAYVSRVCVFFSVIIQSLSVKTIKSKKKVLSLSDRIIKVCGTVGAAVVVFSAKWEWTIIMSNAHITSRGQTSGMQTQTAGPAHDHRNNTV